MGVVENRTDKNIEHEMGTRGVWGYAGFRAGE